MMRNIPLTHYEPLMSYILDIELGVNNVPVLHAKLHWDNMLSRFSRSDASWFIRSSADAGSALRSAVQSVDANMKKKTLRVCEQREQRQNTF